MLVPAVVGGMSCGNRPVEDVAAKTLDTVLRFSSVQDVIEPLCKSTIYAKNSKLRAGLIMRVHGIGSESLFAN